MTAENMRKTIAVLLGCLLLALLPGSVFAAPGRAVAYGTVGDDGAPWRLYDDGTLAVESGIIAWDDWFSPWDEHRDDIARIVFTGPVAGGASLHGLFIGLRYVTEIEGLTYIDTGDVRDMGWMFSGTAVTYLDLSGWDVRNVQNMSGMFSHASGLMGLNLSGWDTGNVTDMWEMFAGTSALALLTLGEQFRFVGGTEAALPSAPNNVIFTGRWQSMNGLAFTSAQLMAHADGAMLPGTWFWQVRPMNPADFTRPETPGGSDDEEDPDFDIGMHWAWGSMRFLYDRGIMTGMPGGDFAPDSDFSHAHLAAMLYRISHGGPAAWVPDDCDAFEHIPAWARPYMAWAHESDLMQEAGGDLTRGQFAEMMHRFAVQSGRDATPDYIEFIVGSDLDPDGVASRAQAATILERFLTDMDVKPEPVPQISEPDLAPPPVPEDDEE